MPPIEFGAITPVNRVTARPQGTSAAPGKPAATPAPIATPTLSLNANEPPVDIDRVSEIRHAIDKGTYPILPARIADEMIAAGYILRKGK